MSGFLDTGADVTVAGRSLRAEELLLAGGAVARRVAGSRAVAVTATATLETVVAVLGCLQAGVPCVPIAPDAGPRERDHVLADSGAELVLGPGAGQDVPVHVDERADPPATRPADSDPALILYTSGTTGLPKGVVHSHGALAGCLDALIDAWDWTAEDVLVHGLPLFHVHGLVLGVLGALRTGSRLVHTGRPDPDRYAAAGGSLYFGVPTVWSRVAADPSSAAALRGARLLVSGSAPLPTPTAHALREHAGLVPVERYGMTESLITLAARADAERLVGSVGTALPGIETRLVDDELQLRGSWVFDGYLHRPDADAEAWTSDGWFRTGDTATLDGQGRFRIVGRTSVDVIKSGGYKIGAGEVEDALLTHPAVSEAAVVGLPDDDLGQRVVAFVVGDAAAAADLSAYVATLLSVHKRPREVRWVESLPRNAMGKVQKKTLLG